MRTQKGEHKIEFYAALNEIKELYFKQGYVAYNILYNKLKKKYNWDMTYNTFIVYAKREGLTKKDPQPKEQVKYFQYITDKLENEDAGSI